LCPFDRNGTIPADRLLDAELTYDISILAKVIDKFTAIIGDRPGLHDSMPNEEQDSFFITELIDDLIVIES
jgi:hypothetical protein